ncbi:MAG: DUF58 domain-containing protein, partial [Hyphomicrobiales bacterium]|nr:DUF58 domain-containing protein [Hyphomicrobiales bacterium]
MGSARLLDDGERAAAPAASRAAAFDLARRLPSIVASARALSSQLAHGVHGRRRAGVGEDFWQFRPHAAGESAASVDWRRSARADRLFVRERE